MIVTAWSGSTTLVNAPELRYAEQVQYETYYPGGLYGGASFHLPRRVTRALSIRVGQRIKIYDGLRLAYEGILTGIGPVVDSDRQGVTVTCLGDWGAVMMMRGLRKPWADTRLDEGVWQESSTAYNGDDKSGWGIVTIDRLNRLRWTPTAVAFGVNYYHRLTYSAPTGQTIKRITFNYGLAEAAQNWQFILFNVTSAAAEWSINTNTTGSADITLATPAASVFFQFLSGAVQTPPADGSIAAEISSVIVYTETGSINATEIAKDVAGYVSELSSDLSLIGSNTLSLVPFVAEGETYADLLTRAAGYGDNSNNAWAVGIRGGDGSSDGKPRLFLEAQPALTDWDYTIRLDEQQLPAAQLEQDLTQMRNYIAVHYQDSQNRDVWVTPDDDATLKDTTYPAQHEWIDLSTTNDTLAKAYAKRYLAARKLPQWMCSDGLSIVGRVRGKNGIVPASMIVAGKRLRVENYLDKVGGVDPIFLITGTSYEDAGHTCTLSFGQPDTLGPLIARMEGGL